MDYFRVAVLSGELVGVTVYVEAMVGVAEAFPSAEAIFLVGNVIAPVGMLAR